MTTNEDVSLRGTDGAGQSIQVYANSRASPGAAYRLSLLVPFRGDDPSNLVSALTAEAASRPETIEIVLLEDGRSDETISSFSTHIETLAIPARLIQLATNEGRAHARNRLAAAARGEWLLFIDAGMRLADGFLARWLDAITCWSFDAAFGGYAPGGTSSSEVELHARIISREESLPTSRRAALGPIATCAGNLMVRREVMECVPFDPGFTGWGWEDVDWGCAVAKRFKFVHVDNPTLRLATDTAETLLRKHREAAVNVPRLIAKHPELQALPSFRLACLLARLPTRGLLQSLTRQVVLARTIPSSLRVKALKIWRALAAADQIMPTR